MVALIGTLKKEIKNEPKIFILFDKRKKLQWIFITTWVTGSSTYLININSFESCFKILVTPFTSLKLQWA